MTDDSLRPRDAAPSVELFDVRGERIRLDALWPDGPTLLTFLRHYG